MDDSRKESAELFDRIAGIYGLFFHIQRRMYARTLERVGQTLNLEGVETVIDIGCGTGALCSVLAQQGFRVTGVDSSRRMLRQAVRRTAGEDITFVRGDVLQGLELEDGSFDLAVCSYVAHGMDQSRRLVLYREMCRLSEKLMAVHDYNRTRSVITDAVETLEGGDYFQFIEEVTQELQREICSIKVIDVGKRSAWYVCAKEAGSSFREDETPVG